LKRKELPIVLPESLVTSPGCTVKYCEVVYSDLIDHPWPNWPSKFSSQLYVLPLSVTITKKLKPQPVHVIFPLISIWCILCVL